MRRSSRSLVLLAALQAGAAAAESPRLRIVARHAMPAGDEVVALAFAAGGRLVALSASALSAYRIDAGGLRTEGRAALQPPLLAVRRPAGILLGRSDDPALWALSNRTPGARLIEVTGDLATRAWADAAPSGLRFERGTSRLLGLDDRRLAAASAGLEAVVAEDGELIVHGWASGIRVGDAVAALGSSAFVTSAPVVEPEDEALWVVEHASPRAAQVVQRLALHRRITALAVRGEDRVAAALDGEAGPEIVLLDRVRP